MVPAADRLPAALLPARPPLPHLPRRRGMVRRLVGRPAPRPARPRRRRRRRRRGRAGASGARAEARPRRRPRGGGGGGGGVAHLAGRRQPALRFLPLLGGLARRRRLGQRRRAGAVVGGLHADRRAAAAGGQGVARGGGGEGVAPLPDRGPGRRGPRPRPRPHAALARRAQAGAEPGGADAGRGRHARAGPEGAPVVSRATLGCTGIDRTQSYVCTRSVGASWPGACDVRGGPAAVLFCGVGV
mmetsp:Transcript_12664/g.42055  ORF Transcript_12664/g.42055 Transcript_12664/m.42055 type:complete len:243 (+) Transcript_12664:1110-1838(+)